MGANNFIALAAISAGASGPGPAIDLFALVPASGLDAPFTVICEGEFQGSISIEGSLDGANFNPVGGFTLGSPSSDETVELSPITVPDVVRYLRVNVLAVVLSDTFLTIGGGQNCATAGGSCGCDCTKNLYTFDEHLDESPTNNPRWFTLGDVSLIPYQGGANRLAVTADPDGIAISVLTAQARSFAFAGSTGNIPAPPVAFHTKCFANLGEVDGSIDVTIGLADIAHDVFVAFFGEFVSGVPTWFAVRQDGVNPTVAISTNVPVATSCETAQLLEIEESTDGTTLTYKINGAIVATIPITAPLKAHLYAPSAAITRNQNDVSGTFTVDFFCATQGYVCLEDPGTLPFSSGGDWIQSTSNVTSGDFTNNDAVNWTLIQTVSLVAKGGTSLIVWGAVASENDTADEENLFRFTLDGVPIQFSEFAGTAVDSDTPFATAMLTVKVGDPPFTVGPHTIALEWKVTGGTGSILSQTKPEEEHATMLAAEVAV